MGIRYDEEKKHYVVSYSRRHPVLKQSRNLRRQGIKSYAEAKRVYRELIFKLAEKFNEKIHPFWPEVVQNYSIFYANQGVSKTTVKGCYQSLRLHTFEKWEKVRINEISTSEIRSLINEDLECYSESYRESILKYLRGVFRYCVEEDLVHKDPTPKIKFKKNEKIKEVLREEEIRTLLSEAKARRHPWFPIWAMACFTGMRNGELYALKWSCIDLCNRTMVVRLSWRKDTGFKTTKSEDDRVVEIAPDLLVILEELQKKRVNEFVLPRIREWDTGTQSKVLRTFLAKINLTSVRFHDLRASWATLMLLRGVAPIQVMSMGGWKDLKTMQVYIRKAGVNIRGITDSLSFFS